MLIQLISSCYLFTYLISVLFYCQCPAYLLAPVERCQCADDRSCRDEISTTERRTIGSMTEDNNTTCRCSMKKAPVNVFDEKRPPSPPLLLSDESNEAILKSTLLNCPLPKDSWSSCCCSKTSQTRPGLSNKNCVNATEHRSHLDTKALSYPDLNICEAGPCLLTRASVSVQASPRSCLKSPGVISKCKSVTIQMPEICNKNQMWGEETVNPSEGGIGTNECSQLRQENNMTPRTSLCLTTKKTSSDSSVGFNQDSGGGLSLVSSPTATCACDANAKATYYQNKLLSTLQILQNKEETIRVQTESLSVAEERISALTERAADLKRDLERKSKELDAVRQTLECCRAEKVDVSVTAKSETEVQKQSDVVRTLQSNLDIIEDLYRECFYETAKQEDLMDMLRNSYQEVRLMDKEKADQIGRLQNVINTQKWSLDRCQDIALEVDNLKTEISNFLNSSTSPNNDSGMWERSEESFASVPETHEELQDIMEQLLKLREILTDVPEGEPCTCGLQLQNRRLKQENEALQTRITDLCSRAGELEKMLELKDVLENKLKEEIATKEEQVQRLVREQTTVTENARDQTNKCEQLTVRLREVQELLGDKCEELERVQQQCDMQQETITEESKRTDNLYKQVSSLGAQLEDSERNARKLDSKLRQALQSCRRAESSAQALSAGLQAAHARGAALCADVRRALAATRAWARRVRAARREQDNIIKEKEDTIAALRIRLHSRVSKSSQCMCSAATDEPLCSSTYRQGSCSRLEPGPSEFLATCENEMASCSSAPTPPRRLFRKKPSCGDRRCLANPWMCDASQQHPIRQDGSQDPRQPYCEGTEACLSLSSPGNVSPTDELFRRVEQLTDALADGYRRWTRSDAR